jgi:hypothetical protein
MNAKQFQRYLVRDGGCIHCGESEAVAPHHRANRGMGGSKARDVPSNVIVMCSWMNSAMESDARVAEQAREYGWKLRSFEDPATVAVFYQVAQKWVLLNDRFGWVESEGDNESPFFYF